MGWLLGTRSPVVGAGSQSLTPDRLIRRIPGRGDGQSQKQKGVGEPTPHGTLSGHFFSSNSTSMTSSVGAPAGPPLAPAAPGGASAPAAPAAGFADAYKCS